MEKQYKIAIFASGSGSNAERIAEHFRNHLHIEITLILTNNPKAYVLERAHRLKIPALVFNREEFPTRAPEWLAQYGITHIVLAGFLWLIPDSLLKAYPDRIINIHPALLPKFGGKGMYGMKVHEMVKQKGEKETGITIHLVNERYDEGPVLHQSLCDVYSEDTPEMIAEKVHQLEYKWYPVVIEQWVMQGSPR